MGDKYRRLKVTPAMAQYLRDIAEGREKLIGPFKDGEDVVRSILGKNWRDAFEDPDAVENRKFRKEYDWDEK